MSKSVQPPKNEQHRTSWVRRLFQMVIVELVSIAIVIAIVFIAASIFRLGSVGQISSIHPNNQTPSSIAINQKPNEYISVDAMVGFQNSMIFLQKGESVILKAEGRIHLAFDQIYNLASSLKPLIIENLDNQQRKDYFSQKTIDKFPPLVPDDKNIFYRNWVSPEGKSEPSKMLTECKLKDDANWGELLAVVIPGDPSQPQQDFSQQNPLKVLKEKDLRTTDLVSVSRNKRISAKESGWLTFIINDAVISPLEFKQNQKCQDFYEALNRANQKLGDDYHKLPIPELLPLVWYFDNIGTFRITVEFSTREQTQ